MFKYTPHTLKKIQGLLEEAGYVVRYEKGNFKSGYCLVENKKVAIVNKYYDLEGKINALMEIIAKVNIDAELLPDKYRNIFNQALQQNPEN